MRVRVCMRLQIANAKTLFLFFYYYLIILNILFVNMIIMII